MRALVGDPMADFTTDAYLTPLVNQVYADQTTQLMSETGSSFNEAVRDVPAVPAGTTDLSAYQAAAMAVAAGNVAGPLNGLVNPITLETKPVGAPDNRYVEARRTGQLPNVSPASTYGASFWMQWEWRGFVIYLTPLNYAVDVRVRGEFSPPALVKDTDVLLVHPRMVEATAYGTAAMIGMERNNDKWVATYGEQAVRVLDNLANMLVRAEQGTTTRIGRTSGRSFGRY